MDTKFLATQETSQAIVPLLAEAALDLPHKTNYNSLIRLFVIENSLPPCLPVTPRGTCPFASLAPRPSNRSSSGFASPRFYSFLPHIGANAAPVFFFSTRNSTFGPVTSPPSCVTIDSQVRREGRGEMGDEARNRARRRPTTTTREAKEAVIIAMVHG